MEATQLRAAGALWTAREIAQQPQVWRQIAQQMAGERALDEFVAPLLADPRLRIVLTGAGSSAYIGQCLAPALSRSGRAATAVATTDLVSGPTTVVRAGPTLVVHFARSGNSPESVAALQLCEQLLADCHHLVITCNPQGELQRRLPTVRHGRSVVLPDACNDRSFAMTSSFTGMLLAAALALRVIPAGAAHIDALAHAGQQLLAEQLPLMAALAGKPFDRVIYLGSNELKALALESALKMLELTDGRVVSIGESPLGLRHGPKTIINRATLVVAFLSNDAYARRYDLDLLHELHRDAVAGRVVALAAGGGMPADAATVTLADCATFTDLELCLPYVVFAQALAALRSMSLGLHPDCPNAAGTVNRVVQGVSIHPFPAGT
ncbi:MAG: SIS domain-containing protein [Proteobacteria bacterium]|nr:SIS domain-containing protein [Pseudomonadota bacterium]